MRRLLLGRCWRLLIIASVGTTPGLLATGCLQTHDQRQAFLSSALADPWAATPGSTAIPGSFIAGAISTGINDQNGDGVADATDLQRVLNSIFWSIQTFLQSQIDVNNPYGWADMGRPR